MERIAEHPEGADGRTEELLVFSRTSSKFTSLCETVLLCRPDETIPQRFFSVAGEVGPALIEGEPDGNETGSGFFGCLGFFASRLPRN
jgi:hypothetical protein